MRARQRKRDIYIGKERGKEREKDRRGERERESQRVRNINIEGKIERGREKRIRKTTNKRERENKIRTRGRE